MPDKVDDRPHLSQNAGMAKTRNRLRPRWQRWLLWTSVRLLLIAGVGAGVGTVQWRARPPDLMAQAKRIASIANANGYYWTTGGELRLYRHGVSGTATLKWNQAAQTGQFVEMLTPAKGQKFAEPARDASPHVQMLRWQDRQTKIIEAYRKEPSYAPGKQMPEPDYTWKIKVMPNMNPAFSAVALSQDSRRVAYTCHIPRVDWRDAIKRRIWRGIRHRLAHRARRYW